MQLVFGVRAAAIKAWLKRGGNNKPGKKCEKILWGTTSLSDFDNAGCFSYVQRLTLTL